MFLNFECTGMLQEHGDIGSNLLNYVPLPPKSWCSQGGDSVRFQYPLDCVRWITLRFCFQGELWKGLKLHLLGMGCRAAQVTSWMSQGALGVLRQQVTCHRMLQCSSHLCTSAKLCSHPLRWEWGLENTCLLGREALQQWVQVLVHMCSFCNAVKH